MGDGSVVRPTGMAGIARHVAVVGVAGLITGVLVGGIGSRIFMRIAGATGRELAQGLSTEAGFTVGELTVGGTIALIVFVGVFVGIIGAVLYTILRPWLGWAGRWRGVVFGIALFAIGSASSDVMNPDNRDFFLLANDVVNVVAIVGLFLAFGITMEEVHRRLDLRMPRDPSWTAAYTAIAGLGVVLGLPLLLGSIFTNSGCDCDPSPWIAWSVVVAAIGTAGSWLAGDDRRRETVSRVVGFTGLVGALGFGLVRAISDAAEIIG